MALVTPNSGDIIQASHIGQLTGLAAGTAGKGQAVALTDVGSASWVSANSGGDASTLWALTVRNQGSGGQALRVQNAAGTSIAEFDDAAILLGVSGRHVTIDPAATPAGPRAYINETALGKSAFMAVRGSGTSSGTAGDATYTATLLAHAFSNGVDGQTNEAVKGAYYLAGGTGGFGIGASGVAEITSDGSWTTGASAHGAIGVFGQAMSRKSGGRVWGANFIGRNATAGNADMVGVEIGIEATETVTNRYGLQIVTLTSGDNSGSTEDLAIKLADKRDPTVEGNLWAVGLGFGSPGVTGDVGFPIKTTGTLIKAYGTKTIANGIDFSTNTFSGFQIKTPNFLVNGAGRVSVKTNSAPTGAPIVLDADGDTYNLQINNPVTQTTVGAAGGASALPATPSEYLIVRIGATDRVIPMYAKS